MCTEHMSARATRIATLGDAPHTSEAAAAERVLTAFVRTGVSFATGGVRHVQDHGARTVNGTAVEEYTGSFPAAAVAAYFGSFVQLPPHTSIEDGTTTVDVDRATGLPVHIVDAISVMTDLAAVRPGLTGRLITTATDSRNFHFDPPR
jgi:hypothetical protein